MYLQYVSLNRTLGISQRTSFSIHSLRLGVQDAFDPATLTSEIIVQMTSLIDVDLASYTQILVTS